MDTFFSWVTISSYTGHFWWTFIQAILIVPIMFYTFCWYFYEFGPKHCKRSLIDILKNSVPGIEFEGRIGESDDFDSLRRCFNHNIIARQFAQTKWLALKCSTKSVVSLVHDCPSSNIDSTAPKLHGYKRYFTMNNESMGKKISESKHIMPITLYFTIHHFSSPEFVFSELHWIPPKVIITSILVRIIITGIFGIITIQTYWHIMKKVCVDRIKSLIRRQTVKPIEADLTINTSYHNYMDDHAFCSWIIGLCDAIQSMASQLHALPTWIPTQMPTWSNVVSFNTFIAKFLHLNARFSCGKNFLKQFSWILSWILRKVGQATHIFSICRNESTFQGITILVYSTLMNSSLLNPLIPFDTDSLFCICNNSATGHICNDRILFSGELVPTIYEVGSATGTLTPNLMGLVVLCLTDKPIGALPGCDYVLMRMVIQII